MADITLELLNRAKEGFQGVAVDDRVRQLAHDNLKLWLTDPAYQEYRPQIEHLIDQGDWDYLLDSFYQVIPFGTGGRRGEVGLGPNRINSWTIQASAQGHAQYLLKQYGDDAKTRGVVFAYDVRQFFTNNHFDDSRPNPIRNLTSQDLARSAAVVYAANGIPVHVFDDFRTTPELSFAVRHLRAVAGAMFSASHNPPDHNGKKVYDEYGGQLVPPDDEALVEEVTQRVTSIETMDYDTALAEGLIRVIGAEVDKAYIAAATAVSLSDARDVVIAYTSLHGCGSTSVLKSLTSLGFEVQVDPKTSNPSGKFENVTFNIPNPEVLESFDVPLEFARRINADILLNSDPDADRIGIMVKHQGEFRFINGNEIAAILTAYAVGKRQARQAGPGIIIKTVVTTNLLREIASANGYEVIGDLLVGFKYIGQEMNKLEQAGKIDSFVMGCEESHGYIAGNYVRDKDAVTAAIWLAELAAELKSKDQTLIDYLNQLSTTYGYFRNYLTEIRMLGATGTENIRAIQRQLRSQPPKQFGRFKVTRFEDCQNRTPIVSETDRQSKDVLIFDIEPVEGTISIKVTVRPSGTEPKSKMYFEIGGKPDGRDLPTLQAETEVILKELEKEVLQACYRLINVDFPDRGFLLFWQLPLNSKLKYFEIEPAIAQLKDVAADQRQEQLATLLKFLGADPIEKVDNAFRAEYGQGIREYLELSK